MRVKVTKEFAGRPDGEPLARTIAVGEVIEGDLAAVALGQKLGEDLDASEKKAAADAAKKRDAAQKAVDAALGELPAAQKAVDDAPDDKKDEAEKALAAAKAKVDAAQAALNALG